MRISTGAVLLAALALPAEAQDLQVPVYPKGVNSRVRKAIDRGLAYLAREQAQDGSWRSAGRYGQYPVAMTSLAGLSVCASGSTPTRGKYSKVVRKAADYVLSKQQANGVFSDPMEHRSMYGHGFGTLFLAQVYGMEEDARKQLRIKMALRRGVRLIARSQSRAGGWIYTPDAGGDEGSVTITQVQALRACRNAGIHVPKEVIDRAIKYIEKSQNPDGGISYSIHSRGSRPAITAAACAVLYNAGAYDSQIAHKAFAYAWRTCRPHTNRGHYFYTQLYMSQACWQMGDQFWDPYFSDMTQRLLRMQQGNGSWRGDGVGTVYGTAIALLIMQIPYNRLPILSR